MTIEQISQTQNLQPVESLRADSNAVSTINTPPPSTSKSSENQEEQQNTQGNLETADIVRQQEALDRSRVRSLTREQQVEQIQEAIEVANSFIAVDERRLEFRLSADSGRAVVRVLSRDSDELIRQIPSEEFLKISDRIRSLNEEFENVKGLLFEASI